MDKEKLNVKIEGNTILNVNELVEYIKTLEYDFNTDEYLKSLYASLLYSDYHNKNILIETIKNKIDEFMGYLSDDRKDKLSNDITYLINNNEIDERVISYMDVLLQSMEFRLTNGKERSQEQKLLDYYISYISNLNDISLKYQNQIEKYHQIKMDNLVRSKRLVNQANHSSGLVTIIIVLELMILGVFVYFFSRL